MEAIESNWIGILISLILAVIFGSVGAVLVYLSIKNRKKAAESQTWPSVTGQISAIDIHQSSSTDSDGDVSYSYSPSVTYTYSLQGKMYTGNKITIGFQQTYSTSRQAEASLSRYTLGSQVSVYYNPVNPNDAVLDRTVVGGNVTMIIGLAFSITGVISLIVGIVLTLME